jgi:hypothetical protein
MVYEIHNKRATEMRKKTKILKNEDEGTQTVP